MGVLAQMEEQEEVRNGKLDALVQEFQSKALPIAPASFGWLNRDTRSILNTDLIQYFRTLVSGKVRANWSEARVRIYDFSYDRVHFWIPFSKGMGHFGEVYIPLGQQMQYYFFDKEKGLYLQHNSSSVTWENFFLKPGWDK